MSIRLEPEIADGRRWAWRLVVDFDPDWQDAVLQLGDGRLARFSVQVPDEWVAGLSIPEVHDV